MAYVAQLSPGCVAKVTRLVGAEANPSGGRHCCVRERARTVAGVPVQGRESGTVRREGTGETLRKRTVETLAELTPKKPRSPAARLPDRAARPPRQCVVMPRVARVAAQTVPEWLVEARGGARAPNMLSNRFCPPRPPGSVDRSALPSVRALGVWIGFPTEQPDQPGWALPGVAATSVISSGSARRSGRS